MSGELLKLRRRTAVALIGPVVVSCSPASALDEAGRCFRDKMRASRLAATGYFACRQLRGDDDERFARCTAAVQLRALRRLAAADERAVAAGFSCPAGSDALALSGPGTWPLRVLDEMDDPDVGPCAEFQVQAASRFAAAYARCVEAAGPGGAAGDDRCEQQARDGFVAGWGETSGDAQCTADEGEQVMTHIEAEFDESAARLVVRCGDGHVAGFEECDDGDTADHDSCSAECRDEKCARTSGEVRCESCPADSVPAEGDAACRCADGFEGEPGACVDIDECALSPGACPEGRPCVNLPGTWACAIPCTADAFHEALAACGAPSGAIAFDCTDTVIPIPGGMPVQLRETECDGLTIDGAGRNITFELDPVCWKTPLLPEQCPAGLEEDGTCRCPDVDSGDEFLQLRGDHNVVRDLTVRGFFEGIPVRGRDNLVEHVRFERMCDDAFGSVLTGVGNVFRRLSVRDGCDKCSENGGVIADTDPDPRVAAHFNAVLEDVDFEACRTPVRVASSGRFLLDHVQMHAGDPEFPCDGPRFSSSNLADRVVVQMRDSSVEGCRRGVRFGLGADGVLTDTRIADCDLRGLRVAGSARVSVEGTTIESNGGGGSAEGGFGGVAVVAGGLLDLGGGTLEIDGTVLHSAGQNSLCANLEPDGNRRDLENAGGVAIAAVGNWWCSRKSPLDRILGLADVEPVLERAPLRVRANSLLP